VKGMLTGPVTILQWSFVRDDQPRAETAKQLALAIRDEVMDLAAAGIRVIQIDEPALREGLPLRRAEWSGYIEWAVKRVPAGDGWRVGRDPDPHAHVLQRIQRRHPRDRENGRGRRLDRERALRVGAARGIQGVPLSQRDRAGCLRHPLAPGTEYRGNRAGPQAHAGGARRPADLGEPRLRVENTGMEETLPSLRNMVQAARQLRPVPAATGAAG